MQASHADTVTERSFDTPQASAHPRNSAQQVMTVFRRCNDSAGVTGLTEDLSVPSDFMVAGWVESGRNGKESNRRSMRSSEESRCDNLQGKPSVVGKKP